jgi:hypothetical protein
MKQMDIREENNLENLLQIKSSIAQSFKGISSISNNEEYERRSFEYYNNLNDLNKNKVYDKYIKSAVYAFKSGYKFGVDDLSMGFNNIKERMPLLINEEKYLIRSIHKETGYLIKSDLDKEILMEVFIYSYKKCLKEKGERYIKIDLEPLPFLEALEKTDFIKNIVEEKSTNKIN